ncbi:MAG: hypothetical protein ACI9LO_003444, partial [Planctomycetota bacterium]
PLSDERFVIAIVPKETQPLFIRSLYFQTTLTL